MKTFKNLTVILAFALVVASCNKIPNTGKYEMKNQTDSVSYALGYFGAKQIKKTFEQSPFKVDSADFKKMAKALANLPMNDKFVDMMEKQFDTLNVDAYRIGFMNEFAYGKSYFTEMNADAYLRKVFKEIKDKKDGKKKEMAAENLKKGQKFLEENKKKPGVKVTDSGLQYEILKKGNGKIPGLKDKVKCNYKGTLINGKVFDSSYDRGEPATFGVDRVIKGWTEALQMMPVGSKWKLYIPSDLAYGERGAGADIGPNEVLIFEIELLDIEPKK